MRPTPEVVSAYSDKVRFRARRQAQYAALRSVPAVTLDGERVSLNINAGLVFDLPHLDQSGADGIGLFRTELQFMIASTFPRLEQQTRIYKAILDAAGERPVTFRSLDVGGDKVLPYFRVNKEENPALGWRAIRMALDRPALFRTQIRALLRAAHGRELRIMLPMIGDVAEFTAARALIDREVTILKRHARPEPKKLLVGAMIEVPALLWQLDRMLPLADFASVGSQRSDAVPVRHRPRQYARRRPLRHSEPGGADGAPRDRRRPRRGMMCRSRSAARWPASRSRPWR